jgi:hypothetical protein
LEFEEINMKEVRRVKIEDTEEFLGGLEAKGLKIDEETKQGFFNQFDEQLEEDAEILKELFNKPNSGAVIDLAAEREKRINLNKFNYR